MKNKSSVVFATASLALCLSFLESAATDSASKNSESADGQTEFDIASYAKEFGTSIDEAARRSRILAARGNLAIDLRNGFESRFAGSYLEHVPDLRIVVRLTGNSPVSSRLAVNGEGSIPIVFLTGARATLEELEAVLDAHQKALNSKIPALQSLYADERTGDIVLVVHATEVESTAYEAEAPALSKMLGHPVRFVFEPSPSQETASARGGALTTSCTTGFSVKETATGRKGILTAAHCANAQGYANYGEPEYVTFPLEFVAERYDPSHDVQWHIPAFGNTPSFEIYASSTSDCHARGIILRMSRAATMVGDGVCHRGAASGYSCGRVESKNHRAGSRGKLILCSNTWVRVTGSDLACTSGDSGGPFFYANTAFGITKSASSTGPNPGDCNSITYMSLDFISGLGLQLL